MNHSNESKPLTSTSLEKLKPVIHGNKSDSARRIGSILLNKTPSKTRVARSQRKENLSATSIEKSLSQQVADEKSDGKRLFVVRHGERVDFTFGSDWFEHSFDAQGHYIRFDMNMPKSLPQRRGGVQGFVDDSPLTIQGLFQARQLGEAMLENNIQFSQVYSSPALRCIQTAHSILNGLGIQKSICIEPGIFEWMAWHQNGLPNFMTASELMQSGFSIDSSHQPIWNTFDIKETVTDYYDRCHKVTCSIVEKHQNEAGNILLVSHKGSVDVCTRQLVGSPKLTLAAFKERVSKVPYCAVSCCQHYPEGKWKLVSPGLPCFTHSANKNYNWKMWL